MLEFTWLESSKCFAGLCCYRIVPELSALYLPMSVLVFQLEAMPEICSIAEPHVLGIAMSVVW